MRDEIYEKHGMVAKDCFCIAPETSGWFRKEIKSIDELKGLKMRFFGLGAQVMAKLGVSTQLLAAADIYPALERGVIDATEFSMPAMDVKLGFHQIAKFNYFPGWHQQVSCSHLLMNKKAWDALPEPYRAMIEVAGQAQIAYTYAETEAFQFDVMAEMRDKHKVQVKRWSDKDLATFEKAWLDVLSEELAKDPLFKKIADHYLDFRKKYAIWGDAQAMKATYQRARLTGLRRSSVLRRPALAEVLRSNRLSDQAVRYPCPSRAPHLIWRAGWAGCAVVFGEKIAGRVPLANAAAGPCGRK